MKKILVTGGCGYIGSHVARAFKQQGDQVVIIDRVRREHTLKDIDGFIEADFVDERVITYIKLQEPDVIVHCAGTSLVGPSIKDPAEYYDNNVVKTVRLLDNIKDMHKKPKILFSSSASVYGEPTSVPIHETAELRPISPYGNTKLTVEHILADYGRAYGVDSVCFRFFNAAGAEPFNHDLGQEPGATHIIARALEASINRTPFRINGQNYHTADGTCIRDYVHVWDIAQAHVKAVKFLDLRSAKDIRVYTWSINLGGNRRTSNLDIANYVASKYGLDIIVSDQTRVGDPAILIADTERAFKILNWSPEHSNIETIIDSAYRWYTR